MDRAGTGSGQGELGQRRRRPHRADPGVGYPLEPARSAEPVHRLPARYHPDRGRAVDPGRAHRDRSGIGASASGLAVYAREPGPQLFSDGRAPAQTHPAPGSCLDWREPVGRGPGLKDPPRSAGSRDSADRTDASGRTAARGTQRTRSRICRETGSRKGTRHAVPCLREAAGALVADSGRHRSGPGRAWRPWPSDWASPRG